MLVEPARLRDAEGEDKAALLALGCVILRRLAAKAEVVVIQMRTAATRGALITMR